MKGIISSLVLAMTMLFAIAAASAQDVTGLFEEGVLLDSNRTYSNRYNVNEDTPVIRGLFDLTGTGEFVPFHYIRERDKNMDLLFLMPKRDFTQESLDNALATWKRTKLTEQVIIFSDPGEGEQLVQSYILSEDEEFLFLNQIDIVALYKKVVVKFHARRKRGDLIRRQ